MWVKHVPEGVLVLGDSKGDCTHNLDDGFTMCLFDGSDSEGTFGKLLWIIDSEEMV